MPFYLLAGEEEAYASEWLDKNLESWLPLSWRALNLHKIDVQKTSPVELLNLIQSFPMGCDHRVVVLKELEKADAARKKQLPTLFMNIPTTTIVVLWLVPGPSDFKKISLGKEWEGLLKESHFVNCSLKKREKQQWLNKSIQEKGITMTQEAQLSFLEHGHGNLQQLTHELDKLSLLGRTVEEQDINLAAEEGESVFQFLDRLSERNASKALRALRLLLEGGEPPLRLLAAIVNQVRLFWQIKTLKKLGKSGPEMAKRIGVHPYRITKGLEQSSNFKEMELPKFIDWLTRADSALKTGKQEPEHLLELLVARICK